MNNQCDWSEIISLKREKFRVSIRNQRLSQEFQKKRKTITIQQRKNQFLEKLDEELRQYITKDQLNEEDQNNIKLLLKVILKALEDDNEIDQEFANNLVKKIKYRCCQIRFFIAISRIDDEFQLLIGNVFAQTFFHIDSKAFQIFDEFDDPQLLDYFDNILITKNYELLEQALRCIIYLMKEKQAYRDFAINNDFEKIMYLTDLDKFRQYEELILAMIQEAVFYCVGINLEKFQPIYKYVIDSYFDENVGIRRMAIEVIKQIMERLPNQQEYQFVEEFIKTPVFRKIFADANKINFDFSSQSLVLSCFGFCENLTSEQVRFFEQILQQKLSDFDVNSNIRVQLYWCISNKILNPTHLSQLMNIVQCIIQNYQEGPIMIQNELSYVILNVAQTVMNNLIQGSLEQLSKLIEIGLIEACDHLFGLGEAQMQQNILITLNIILKSFKTSRENNDLIVMTFEEIKERMGKNQLIYRIMDSKCDPQLINAIDIYF